MKQLLTNLNIIKQGNERLIFNGTGQGVPWDVIQDAGNRKDIRFMFANWNTGGNTIRPKIKMTGSTKHGQESLFYNSKGIKKLEAAYFDFSNAPDDFYMCFANCEGMEEIEDIGIVASDKFQYVFYWNMGIKKIAKITVNDSTVFHSPFEGCSDLEEIRFDGTIGQSGLDFQWSDELTVESLRSILTALSKNSAQANGKSITFSTDSRSIIENDAECLNQMSQAINAGWTIAYA